MCDTLVHLTDAGVLFAKNSDRDPVEAQQVEFHAAARHEPGRIRLTHTDIDQVAQTNAVLISRPWWMWGAEMGTNEHGLTIGNEAVFTRRAGDGGGDLTGMDLLRLALERASNRHEAVQVIVSLLEQHGQGGGASQEHPRFRYDNSYLIADPTGAVVLETAGRRHAVEEVRGARSISNGLTIPGFAERYADPLRGRVAQCSVRQARTGAAAQAADGVLDLMSALRDHGGDGSIAYRGANGALAAPCAHAGGLLTSTQTTASWVANATTGEHWVTGTAAPCTSLFKPVALAPPSWPQPTGLSNRADTAHLWWRHERLHRGWTRDPQAYADTRRERALSNASGSPPRRRRTRRGRSRPRGRNGARLSCPAGMSGRRWFAGSGAAGIERRGWRDDPHPHRRRRPCRAERSARTHPGRRGMRCPGSALARRRPCHGRFGGWAGRRVRRDVDRRAARAHVCPRRRTRPANLPHL
ncbi:Peptidase U34, dipeptidase (modular protein) [Nostocoides jenkinsii Ben 74]|uniref:Peptidase U34, dipeptidase (Modular protein) n=1 Tax=Nostocoides jenkinsii Ben 74 TaxID=1193518 RepID=A0A077MCG7_9MICO|nr:Peptidase U34, dipeptidase (modular protein) [Tetrasphaera jenkinsii Ben 74]